MPHSSGQLDRPFVNDQPFIMIELPADTTTSPLRIGLIGASRVATYAVIDPARAIDGVRVDAVAARDPARAAEYAGRHGIARVHASYADLCRDPDVDLIYIGTHPAVHREIAVLAIEAGKPVLVEKPFAMTAAEARDMLDRARAAGVPVFEAMHSLHHPLFARLLALLRQDVLGPHRRLDAEFSVPIDRNAHEFRWRADLGGGALMDLGIYPLAWARRLLGQAFTVERASADIVDGVDAAFDAELCFPSGVTASVRSSMRASSRIAQLTLTGERGSLIVVNPLAPQHGHRLLLSVDGVTTEEKVTGPSTYEAQLAAVRDAVQGRATFPLPADDPYRSMQAIDAVRAAFPAGR